MPSPPTAIPSPDPGLLRHLPVREVPAYRFVPGLNPHPFRHPEGHSYTDGSAPSLDTTDPNAYLWGIDLFNHRYWWEAHEVWEGQWHQSPDRDTRDHLQSLIQASAYLLKQHLGHTAAAVLLLAAIEQRNRALIDRVGETYNGLNLAEWVQTLQKQPYPLLSYKPARR